MTPIIIGDINTGLTLAQAITEVKERGFHYLDDSRVTFALNNAKNAFEDYGMYPWPWLIQTATGTAPLSLTDVKYVLSVVDSTNRTELPGLDALDIVDIDPNTATTGTPGAWWLDGTSTLRTYPVSSTASMSVRYVRFSPQLGAPADTALIPSRHQAIWIDLAVIELAKDDENFGDVTALVQDTTRRLEQLIGVYDTRNRQSSSAIRIIAGAEDW